MEVIGECQFLQKRKAHKRLITGHCIPAIDRYNLPLARRDQIPVKILDQKSTQMSTNLEIYM